MANVQQLYQTHCIPEYRRFCMNLIQDTNSCLCLAVREGEGSLYMLN